MPSTVTDTRPGLARNRERLWTLLRGWLPVLLWMGAIFWLSAQPRLPLPPGSPDVVTYLGHFVEYAVLAALIRRALRPAPAAEVAAGRLPLLALAFALALAYALTDEWHQSFVPGRFCSLLDLAFDATGAAAALALAARVAHPPAGR